MGLWFFFLVGWEQCPIFSELCKMKMLDFFDRILWLDSVKDSDFISQFIVCAWLVWSDRNSKLHGGKGLGFTDFWGRAGSWIDDFRSCSDPSPLLPPVPVKSRCWLPPQLGHFKLNVDASLLAVGEGFGVSAVIRDDFGVLVAVQGLYFSGQVLVEVAEARAVLEGLKLAAGLAVFPLVVESDALSVVNLCAGLSLSRGDVDNLIFDVQALLSSLRVVSIGFVPRACNVIAHSIARRALFSCSPCFWINSFPSWLSKLAMNDVSSFGSV
ncbi:hypothetical protein ACOSQ2_023253 [Xanthoceras sorbifolium]